MIYLDNAATTIPYSKSIEKANQFNNESFFNPSALYQGGIDNKNELLEAKKFILSSISAYNHQVIFTSCGSESDNQAIFCNNARGVFVTDKGEHSAVYNSFLELKRRGVEIEFIDLNPDGSVNVNKLIDFIKNNNVGFVSIVHVNNETGAINDVNKISSMVKKIKKDIVFHVDGVQAYGKLDYKIGDDIDFYSISAHKINALKGVGAIIKKKTTTLHPLVFGGGQEDGFRSGTENIFGIKVFEYSAKIHYENLINNFNYVSNLKKQLIDGLDKSIFTVLSGENSSPYILSISAQGLRGEVIMHSLEEYGIVVGNGSACSSKNRYSRVLEACGFDKEVLDGVLRISFSPENTGEEISFVFNKLNEVTKKLKGIMA